MKEYDKVKLIVDKPQYLKENAPKGEITNNTPLAD